MAWYWERGLPWGRPRIESCSWLLIEIISFLWSRKLLIHLMNFLLRPIDVSVKSTLSNQTSSKVLLTSRKIPVAGWPLSKPYLIVSNILNRLLFVLLFFLESFCCLLNFAVFCPPSCSRYLLRRFPRVYHGMKWLWRSIASY